MPSPIPPNKRMQENDFKQEFDRPMTRDLYYPAIPPARPLDLDDMNENLKPDRMPMEPQINRTNARVANPFDVPVPGQSLTKTPGNQMWEKPPQFTNDEDATEFVYDQLMKPRAIEQMLALMDADVPIEHMARTILFAGFSEGKW